jgi:hypothetical protein
VIAGSVQVRVGPLSSTAAGLAGLTGVVAPAAGPVDPAVFLARLMTLRGSVELGQQLEAAIAQPGPAAPGGHAPLSWVVAGRLDALREDVVRTFADPFGRRTKLPTPEQLRSVLVESGALGGVASRARMTTAETVWAPCADLLTRTLDRVRFEVTTLRDEICPALATLGPDAAHLERLDAALFEATAAGRADVEDRLLVAIGRSFAKGFAAAALALPANVEASDLAPWFATGGLLRAALDAGRDAILGVLAHDHRRLAALVAGP